MDKDKDEAQSKASCRRNATNRAAVRIKNTHAIIGAHFGVFSLILLAAYVTNVRSMSLIVCGMLIPCSKRNRAGCGLDCSDTLSSLGMPTRYPARLVL
ncbi:hypothetical protein V8C42DRAFT_335550, partial [Trichoderma barbatum]